MRYLVVEHGFMFFTGGEHPRCPECSLPSVKFKETGEMKAKISRKVEVGEGDEKHTEFVEEDVLVPYAEVSCTECGCIFKVSK